MCDRRVDSSSDASAESVADGFIGMIEAFDQSITGLQVVVVGLADEIA